MAARDGAQLAVDEINQDGGINGHPLELIIKDDKGDPDVAPFQESRNRVRSMAQIHEQLTYNENLAQVNMASYIEELTALCGLHMARKK